MNKDYEQAEIERCLEVIAEAGDDNVVAQVKNYMENTKSPDLVAIYAVADYVVGNELDDEESVAIFTILDDIYY